MLRFLRSPRRHRIVNPWHVARPLAELLAALGELLVACSVQLDDERWRSLGEHLDALADELRRHQ